ncbi:TRAP transporter small permease subunit [Sphingomonas naphthae]|uniref:TRAP transporter small permease protein n=1 Tax=Sphingomonas naphthae TaxID=1813468 RepID=A0ABY7TH89_9SPHN|nr:TRAP transporter small permease subunit [Sphingomonas naphthae]WCT72418.1 TRAP transporter small permease subunit [Sphingomonas naphthae]
MLDADALPESSADPSEVDPPPEKAGWLGRAVFFVGSAGLLGATATDALAVLGRHTGFTLLGSIEVVQLAVVLIASAAMVSATLQRAHASVHIFTERMKPATADAFARFASVLCAALFLLAVVGSLIVLADLWAGHERTELLGLPLRWFRLLWIATALTVAGLFIRQIFARRAA